MREDHQNFDRSDDCNLESSIDYCASMVVNSATVEISEPSSSMTVDLKRMKTWDKSFVDKNASVPVKPNGISTRLISRKHPLEKRSSRGPNKAINEKKGRSHDLIFENTSVLVPVKAEYISTRLHDKLGTHISKIKPSGKQQFKEIGDPGPSKATNLKQIKNHVLSFPNLNGSVPDDAECISVRLHDEPAANIFKHEPLRKMPIEEMSNASTKAVNPRKRKTPDLGPENLSASVFVKAEYVSAQLHEQAGTHSSKIEPSRKRRFEEISDQGSNRTVNRKQRKTCDFSFENVTTPVPARSNEESGTCMSRIEPPPLVAAIKANKLSIFKKIYESEASLNREECLQYAVEGGRADFVEYILKSGVNPSYCFHGPVEDHYLKNIVSGETPLHQAVRKGDADMCQLLLLHGAELETTNVFDETPLVTAVKANKLDIVKILLKSGANPNNDECLSLHYALQKGRADMCQLLISYGAQFDLMSAFDPTASVTAITTNKVNLVENLLKSDYDPNFRFSICVDLIPLSHNASN
jgi:hypothetical protein